MEGCVTAKIKQSIGKETLAIKMHVLLVLCIILTSILFFSAEFIQKAQYTCKSSNKFPSTRQNLFFFFSFKCMHAHWAENTENKTNALYSVMEKTSHIFSKTNILISLITNYIMIHCDFFARPVSFLMSFANSSCIYMLRYNDNNEEFSHP